ncbi:MAG TPA: DUF4328 domain-containing protein [Ilumatobacteraceae bacterium]|nr:DUF4328 domain-containing protein [Ilumatobacteraceae bacterium]
MSDLPPPPPNMQPPPGYVAYGGGAVYSAPLERVKGLGTALTVLLAIMAPLQLLAVFQQIRLTRAARDFLDGQISESQLENKFGVGVGSLGGILVIPVAVLTMILMYKMAKNVRTLGRHTTFGPGWGIASWFTPPCVVYAVPWLMFRELWKASDPDVTPGDSSWRQGKVPAIINVWWVLYGLLPLIAIATSATYFVAFRTGSTDWNDVAKKFNDFAAINLALSVVAVGTVIVYLVMLRMLVARHAAATREV